MGRLSRLKDRKLTLLTWKTPASGVVLRSEPIEIGTSEFQVFGLLLLLERHRAQTVIQQAAKQEEFRLL